VKEGVVKHGYEAEERINYNVLFQKGLRELMQKSSTWKTK